MGVGYTRQSAADIQNGEDIVAGPLNTEFNQLESAFHGTTGHSHDGTTGEGPLIDLTLAVTGILPVANGGTGLSAIPDLLAIEALVGTAGGLFKTAADTWALRTLAGTANEITMTDGDGVAGAPTVSLPAALTFTGKTITGGTITQMTSIGATSFEIGSGGATDTTLTRVSAGVAAIEGVNILTTATGQPLDSTLTALATYNTNGILTQTAADTFTGRTITGTANQITVTNGDGVAGAPILSLPSTLAFPSGQIIGWDSSDVTLTHSANTLTFAGADTGYIFSYSDDGAGLGPNLIFERISASPAASDFLGQFVWRGRDSAANSQDYVLQYGRIEDPTSGSEDASMSWEVIRAGSLAAILRLGRTAGNVFDTTAVGLPSGKLSFPSGGLIDFNAGDVTITHAANTLTFAGATTGYVFNDGPVTASVLSPINVQAGSYTLVLTDAGKIVYCNSGSANNLTVPLNSSVAYPTGTRIDIAQYGAGQTTVVATGGVTIRSTGSKLKLFGQYSGATLVKIGTDEWYLFGDITA